MLDLQNVSISYMKNEDIIKDISFSLEKGGSLGIIGANGAGKTTLFKGILGLVDSKGHIMVDGITVEKKSLPLVRQKIGYVSSDSDSQMFMPTVFDDMMFAPLNYGMCKDEALNKVNETLELLGIESIRNEHNYKLSGGQKRMASVAVALTMNPDILLMDEPSANLDPKHRRKLINTLNNIATTKVIATHDLDLVLEVCDRVLILSQGKIVADGESFDILANKDLLEENDLELPFCLSPLPNSLIKL